MRRRSFLFAAGAVAMRGWSAESALGAIVFTQADGLWSRTLPDGKTRRLVAGANLEAPRFSPSGKWIAYIGSETLHVVAWGGGEPIALTKALQAQWMPGRDGLWAQDQSGLQLFAPSTGFRAPTRQIPGASLPVVFSPDGGAIAYGLRSRLVLERPGGDPKVLVSKDGAGLIPAAWIGDGVLYWENPSFSASIQADGLKLFRIPADGGEPQSMGVSTLVHDDVLAPSPDGKLLAMSAGGNRFEWAGKRIVTLDPNSAAVSYRTDNNVAAVSPAWSPRGDRIAYSAAPSPVGSERLGGGDAAKRLLAARRIWAGSRQLTDDGRYRDERPMWSADGSHILFGRIDRANRQSLWLTEVERPSPIEVAGPLHALELSGEDGAWFGYYGYIDWGAMMDWGRTIS
jgi:Tol biopolymer transport system component